MRLASGRRLATEWWLVALLSSLLVLLLTYDRTTNRLDTLVYDVLIGWDSRDPDPRVLLVTIDSRTLQAFGAWPWPRDLQARLITEVAAGAPRAIAYDVLLLEMGQDRGADAKLGEAIAKAPSLFLPLLLDMPGSNGARFDAVLPPGEIAHGVDGLGHVNLIADPDGLFRRARLTEGDRNQQWPHLMELLRRTAEPRTPLGQASNPSRPPVLIPFAGPPGHFPSIGAEAVLRGEVPPELLRDRMVIVGVTAQGLGDTYPTSRGRDEGLMSGAEIQANILDGLLSRRFVSEVGFLAASLFALLPLWALLAAFRLLPPRAILWFTGGLSLLLVGMSAVALFQFRIWLPPVTALAGLALLYPFWGWRKLSAVSAYMLRQLEQLRAEPHALARTRLEGRAPDPVSRQILLLDEAIVGLRDMRHFVSDSLHQLPDAVLVLDEEGVLLLANRKARNLLQRVGVDQDRPHIEAVLARLAHSPEAAAAGNEVRRIDWPPKGDGRIGELWAPDGRCFELRVGFRRNASAEQLGWLVRLSDITEVQTARRQREDMLNFLTHDMRSPQASILATLAIAKEGEISDELVGRVEGYARRTLHLVDGFVQLARAEMPQYRLEILNLSDLLIDAVDTLWPQVDAKKMRLTTVGDDREWLVEGERSLLTRTLINILDNAVKYCPDGAEIRCELAAGTCRNDQAVLCSISDDGPGIAAEQLCRLFDRFRVAAEGERRHGTGLGLAFAQAVVTRHGGTIECVSTPGKGTTFVLALPLAQSDEDQDR